VKRKKCVQKEFDRADIVRDVRFPRLLGLGESLRSGLRTAQKPDVQRTT
jgi:hypothetical protein